LQSSNKIESIVSWRVRPLSIAINVVIGTVEKSNDRSDPVRHGLTREGKYHKYSRGVISTCTFYILEIICANIQLIY